MDTPREKSHSLTMVWDGLMGLPRFTDCLDLPPAITTGVYSLGLETREKDWITVCREKDSKGLVQVETVGVPLVQFNLFFRGFLRCVVGRFHTHLLRLYLYIWVNTSVSPYNNISSKPLLTDEERSGEEGRVTYDSVDVMSDHPRITCTGREVK